MSGGIGGIGGGGGGDILSSLRNGRIAGREDRLKAAAHLLKGTFYQEVFKAMRETVPEGGALSGGTGQEMFEGLLDQSIADSAALRSERGLGSALYRQLTGGAPEPAPEPAAATKLATASEPRPSTDPVPR